MSRKQEIAVREGDVCNCDYGIVTRIENTEVDGSFKVWWETR